MKLCTNDDINMTITEICEKKFNCTKDSNRIWYC